LLIRAVKYASAKKTSQRWLKRGEFVSN